MAPDPERPETYARRVLLAVTGLSPQIVTETLFALAVKRSPVWIPTEIHIITTRPGADNARLTLLSDDPGWFHRLREDYGLPAIAFGIENIQVITGPDGLALEDILEDVHNAAVGDFITEKVRAITSDAAASVHVSMAGGRKTMGFYVGYALSLFGRPQDRLSHVLISQPFEALPEFFYPAPRTRVIHRNGQALDAKDARVQLGEIPFVRLREGLPKRLLDGRARFSEAVAEAQKALLPLALHLDAATRTVTAGGESFVLPPAQFAFYWMMAERCKTARGGLHRMDQGLGQELLAYYARLENVHSGVFEQAEKAYRSFDQDNFDPTKTHINGALRRALGERRAEPYLIVKLEKIADTRYHRFGLALPPEAITVAAASLPGEPAAAAMPYASASPASPAAD
jgi:CRISPR-associated protein (TIGR02584 family)